MGRKNPAVWCADLMVPVEPRARGSECTVEGEAYPQDNEIWTAAGGTIRLAGAANEVVAFQLVLEKKAGKLDGIKLDGADGVALSVGQNIAVPVGDRFVDDAVVPVELESAGDSVAHITRKAPKVKGRQRQTYTVELYIPKGAPAGRTPCRLVLVLNGQEKRLHVDLRVYGFELPDEDRCTADINNYSRVPYIGGIDADTTSAGYIETMLEYFRMAREHRALFHLLPYGQSGGFCDGYAPRIEGVGRHRRISDWTPFDRTWGALLDGSAFKGCRAGERPIEYLYSPVNATWPARYEVYGKPGYFTEYKNGIRQMGEHFVEKGWTRTKLEIFFNHKARWKYYPWDMDEIYYERDNHATVDFGKAALDAVRGIPGIRFVNRIDSSWIFDKSAHTEMQDLINLWVVNRGSHSHAPDEVERLRRKGQEVWFYGGAGPLEAPNRLDSLQWPWIAWGRETDGFTWWNGLGCGLWDRPGPGGGHCFWPGDRFGIAGPLATVRLKVVHRGMQDHAYLTLLTKKTGSRQAADAAIEKTIGCKDREDWYQRQEAVENAGADIQTTSTSGKPWNTAPWPKWGEATRAIAEAIERT